MNKTSIFSAFAFVAILASVFAFRQSEVNTPASAFKWYTLEEAIAANEKAPKKFFIDVYTDWCHWCKVMDSKTFAQEEVKNYLAANFYPVKLNAEQRENISFKGKDYKFIPAGRRGIHGVAYELLGGRASYPSIVYLDESLNSIHITKGFKPAEQLMPELEFVAKNSYKKAAWNTIAKR